MRFLWRPYNRKPADPFDPGQIKHDNIRAVGSNSAAAKEKKTTLLRDRLGCRRRCLHGHSSGPEESAAVLSINSISELVFIISTLRCVVGATIISAQYN